MSMNTTLNFLKGHWDTGAAFGGMLASVTLSKFDAAVGGAIALATLAFILFRAFVWFLRARITWINRNNTKFFEKTKDETE